MLFYPYPTFWFVGEDRRGHGKLFCPPAVPIRRCFHEITVLQTILNQSLTIFPIFRCSLLAPSQRRRRSKPLCKLIPPQNTERLAKHIPATKPSNGRGNENNDDIVLDLMIRVRLDLFSASFGTRQTMWAKLFYSVLSCCPLPCLSCSPFFPPLSIYLPLSNGSGSSSCMYLYHHNHHFLPFMLSTYLWVFFHSMISLELHV